MGTGRGGDTTTPTPLPPCLVCPSPSPCPSVCLFLSVWSHVSVHVSLSIQQCVHLSICAQVSDEENQLLFPCSQTSSCPSPLPLLRPPSSPALNSLHTRSIPHPPEGYKTACGQGTASFCDKNVSLNPHLHEQAPAGTFNTHPTTCPQTEQQLFSLDSSYFQGKNNHLLEERRVLVTGWNPGNPAPGAALTLCPVGAWSIELSLHKVSGELLVETSYTLFFQAHGRIVSYRLGARERERAQTLQQCWNRPAPAVLCSITSSS